MTATHFLSSCVRFKRGFESEPTLHSGINYAVLLLAAGHQFDTSFELRKVGEATTEMHSRRKPKRSFLRPGGNGSVCGRRSEVVRMFEQRWGVGGLLILCHTWAESPQRFSCNRAACYKYLFLFTLRCLVFFLFGLFVGINRTPTRSS